MPGVDANQRQSCGLDFDGSLNEKNVHSKSFGLKTLVLEIVTLLVCALHTVESHCSVNFPSTCHRSVRSEPKRFKNRSLILFGLIGSARCAQLFGVVSVRARLTGPSEPQ